MKRFRSDGDSPSGNYPPIYYARLHEAARKWWTWFAFISTVTVVSVACFIWGWLAPVAVAAPLMGAIWLYSVIVALASLGDSNKAHVLPYFSKKGLRVEADTFLYGLAIARNFQILEKWATERGVLPLSTFGWNDDLQNQTVVWHEAAQGIRTVKALLEKPELTPDMSEDLGRLLDALQRAADMGIPFCFLLRIGDYASGAEMDARQGTFF